MLPGEFLTCHNKKLGLVDRQHHARFDPHVGQLGTYDAAHPRRVRHVDLVDDWCTGENIAILET